MVVSWASLPGKFKSSISANPSKSSFETQVPILTRDPSELDVAEPLAGVVVSATVGWILDGVNDVDPRTFDGKVSVPRALIVQPSAKRRTFRKRCSTSGRRKKREESVFSSLTRAL